MLNHRNIIRLEEYRESSQSIAVIMEYGGQRNLAEYILHHRTHAKKRLNKSKQLQRGSSSQKLHIPHLLEIYSQVLQGVEYLHSQQIGHRDLKLENIVLMEPEETLQPHAFNEAAVREDSSTRPFLMSGAGTVYNTLLMRSTEGLAQSRSATGRSQESILDSHEFCNSRSTIPKVKIIDFGFAIRTEGTSDLRCGTPAYMSPELVQKKTYKPWQVDIWALGVILFRISPLNRCVTRIIFNSVPFHATSLSDLYHRIVTQDLIFPSSTHASCSVCKAVLPLVKELIAKMLHKDAGQRPTVTELLGEQLFANPKASEKGVSESQQGKTVSGVEVEEEWLPEEEEDPSLPAEELEDPDFEDLQHSSSQD